jgi:hypothetical protein
LRLTGLATAGEFFAMVYLHFGISNLWIYSQICEFEGEIVKNRVHREGQAI